MIKKKCINISGKIVCGIRAAFVKENGLLGDIIPRKDSLHEAILKLQSKMKLYKSLLISSPSNLAFKDGKFFCYYGSKKFYYPMSEEKGVFIFIPLVPDRKDSKDTFISNYIQCARMLAVKDIFPEILGIQSVNIDIDVHYVKKNLDNLGQKIKKCCKDDAVGMIVKRIVSPSFDFNLCEKNRDMVISIFTKLWKEKRYDAYNLSNNEKDFLYGNGFSDENPLFTKYYFKEFCKKIINEVKKNKMWKYMNREKSAFMNNLDLKYGNILYSTEEKKWYYIDFC